MALILNSPARIHLGFLDLNRKSKRNFGSLGLAITKFENIIEVNPADSFKIIGNESQKILQTLNLLNEKYILKPCTIKLIKKIPEHCGLGSGTQLALSLGKILSIISRKKIPINDLASVTHRGRRSGIGIQSFKTGGFIIDGGKINEFSSPPTIFKSKWPESWKIILIFDKSFKGLSGVKEKEEFENILDISNKITNENCYNLVMKIMPGLVEKNFHLFCSGINTIQNNTSKMFFKSQGGKYSSKKIEFLFESIQKIGNFAFGQSSWGPTGFIFCENNLEQQKVLSSMNKTKKCYNLNEIRFVEVTGRNNGFFTQSQ